MKYLGPPPTAFDDLVIGIERVEDIVDELKVLHKEHYLETETLYLDTPFNPDYARYIEQERAQQYVQFTVRSDWKLVGYLQYYVFRDMHTQGVLQAREDALFITKQYRGRGIAPQLLSYAEAALQLLGCSYVGMSSKGPAGGPDIGGFLESKGYRPVATFFVKKLET